MSKLNDQPIEKYDSVWSLFVRVFWALIGNVILLFTAISIFRHKGKIFYTADIVFWITVVALIFARYIDIKFWGSDKEQPVTMSHWRKYSIVILISSTVIWLLAHLVNHLFVR